MAASRSVFVCQSCGQQSAKWLGRCPECNGWDTFAEETRALGKKAPGRAGAAVVVPLTEVADEQTLRFTSGSELLDRVLGGGIVAGSAVLLAGEPGIGKSTLLD